ncbi:MAG: 1,4-dihydroxy-2-naphthoate polyprenyltransferase [Candidatus Omnitrophota bacterium]|nr:1,4-dihydroxy-2-naphthoate polyprenyltransferase [Candidatus Omnitrophota bacterium]MDZ4241990.1 1,4-dihydroxy-2-naphthoate polyprenyltransferase [Candidatus Omnitrophota bacterium]
MTNQLKIWTLAARPKTLPAAIAPVVMATGMAFGDGIHHWPSAAVAMAAALLIQIGTNLANDYFDFKKGADTEERKGPTRVTQAGLVSPSGIVAAMTLTFLLAAACCVWLMLRAGWPIAVIGALSILSGIFYTAGPRPLGYLGLGEIFVLVFFGPVAVAGTYYVQSFEMNYAVILAGLGPGLLSAAILAVNNLRDIPTDSRSGKRTLAVRFGKVFAQREYLALVLLAGALPALIFALIQDHLGILACVALPLLAIKSFEDIFTFTDAARLNHTLAATGRLLLLYSVVFVAGWIL